MAMSGNEGNQYDKEYEAFRIFEQIQTPEEAPAQSLIRKEAEETSLREDIFYEIEYDSAAVPGDNAGEECLPRPFTLEPDRVEQRPRDEVRELFNRMRDIARESRYLNFGSRKFFDRKMQQENARIFYRQGMMMKDFEDEYGKAVPYSSYFPDYQMMGYDQLRTYFTWRTRIRQGNITHMSLSYAFLYIYELLNNIGVDDPQEGLERLMLFWDAYRIYDKSVDRYVLRWLKDYHIYYGLDRTFREFVNENGLAAHYPNLSDSDDQFDLFCSVSKYEIKKSNFYAGDTKGLIQKCFYYTLGRLRECFKEKQKVFDELVFCPVRNMAVWIPFQDALFYPALHQPDRRVVLSEKEIYVCSGNQWTFSAMITAESGRRLVGYVMKQMEVQLRRLTNYKYKLSAGLNMLSPVMADELAKAGICLEKLVAEAAEAFYREETRTIVRVNPGVLEKIRQEALTIQEKLTVPEEAGAAYAAGGQKEDGGAVSAAGRQKEWTAALMSVSGTEGEGPVSAGPVKKAQEEAEPVDAWRNQSGLTASWEAFRSVLTEIEMKALSMIARGEAELKELADESDIMLEVLIDGINEKAMDSVGDSILDGEAVLYDDYAEQVKEMVGLK